MWTFIPLTAGCHSVVWIQSVCPSPIDGHLDCSHVLAVVTSVALNIYLQVFVEHSFSISQSVVIYIGVESLGYQSLYAELYEELPNRFPRQLHHLQFLSNAREASFSTSLSALNIFHYRCFHCCRPSMCAVVSHWDFHLHFPSDWWQWSPFHIFGGHLCILFGEMSIQVLCLF